MWFLRKKKTQALPGHGETAVAVHNNGLIKNTAEERIECKIAVVREERRQIALIDNTDKFCNVFLELVHAVFECDAHKLNGFDDEELLVLANLLKDKERMKQETAERPWLNVDLYYIHRRYAECLSKIRAINGNQNYFPLEQLRNKVKGWIEKSQAKQEEVKNG